MRTPKRLTNFARAMRREPTEAERRLWHLLRDRRLASFKFRRQYAVAGYILDFYCVSLRLCVELDGGQHYDDGGPAERYDEARTGTLNELAITVLRFENPEIFSNPQGVLKTILLTADELAAHGPHPIPLPAYRERGQEGH